MKIKITRQRLIKWADIILNDCFKGIVPEDVVMIKGEPIAWPLIDALQEKVLKAGATADVSLIPPDNEYGRVYGAAVAKYANARSLKLPAWQIMRYRGITKYIEILGMETPETMRNINESTMQRIIQLHGKIRNIQRKVPSVFTMFPTPAYAQTEGMSFKVYKDTVCSASTQPRYVLKKMAELLAAKLRSTKAINILTREPGIKRDYNLVLNIHKKNILQDFDVNIPSGEVYTSPDAGSVSGEVFCDLPFRFQGTKILQGVYLKFKDGRVVESHAKRGSNLLDQVLTTDAGAKRIGEVAFGYNPMLKRTLLHPLFSEKLSGTMHLALGNGFSKAYVTSPDSRSGQKQYKKMLQTGVANISAQHVDLVISFRKGGAGKAVFFDNEQLKIMNGNWNPG